VNVPLIVAGFVSILGAAIHGVGGEVLIVRRLSPGTLPSTGFAALAVALGAANRKSSRSLLRHPGPAVLTATAALAWWGVL
jgi:hypothetical protein